MTHVRTLNKVCPICQSECLVFQPKLRKQIIVCMGKNICKVLHSLRKLVFLLNLCWLSLCNIKSVQYFFKSDNNFQSVIGHTHAHTKSITAGRCCVFHLCILQCYVVIRITVIEVYFLDIHAFYTLICLSVLFFGCNLQAWRMKQYFVNVFSNLTSVRND